MKPEKESKTFCILPWIHAGTRTDGKVGLCCVAGGDSGIDLNQDTLSDYENSDYVKDARRRMLAGEKVRACGRCYAEEEHGYKSHRMIENIVWKDRLGEAEVQRLIEKTKEDGSLDEGLQYLDLRLGNTCNMQCIMCQPRESSRWLPAARQLSELTSNQDLKNDFRYKVLINQNQFEWYRNENFWTNLRALLPKIKEIVIAGGEPFLIKEYFTFLKVCCESGEAGHIRLHIHTNGTIFPTELIPFWKHFERVDFFISIDGIGEAANYVRYPSNWEKIKKNIFLFDALAENTFTLFNYTNHALNVYRLPEVLDWFDRQKLRNRSFFLNLTEFVCVSLAFSPLQLNIRVLPVELKKVITARFHNYIQNHLVGQNVENLLGILEYMNAQDESDKMPILIEYTRVLDIQRGTNLVATFPELAPFWD